MPKKPTAERDFKGLVRSLLIADVYPSPTNINRQRGKLGLARPNSLNGRECQWLREVWAETDPTHPQAQRRAERLARDEATRQRQIDEYWAAAAAREAQEREEYTG